MISLAQLNKASTKGEKQMSKTEKIFIIVVIMFALVCIVLSILNNDCLNEITLLNLKTTEICLRQTTLLI